ncbi:MAG: DUF402 domain-containing protein [Bacilli bacterium]|nr:DUF402 domain-containing protein [Bacilli bacterium]
MKEVEALQKIDIISYKHDGELHRVWRNVDKIYEDKELLILINNEVDVIDGDGRKWKTREPAVCYFFKKYWFNVICMIRQESIYYYCNLSSPYVVDQEGIKYIDYDLDIKVFPNGELKELDRDEYDFNIKYLHYSDNIKQIIEKNMHLLLDRINKKEDPFNKECVLYWYNEFLKNNN